jgi:UDPglucose 6-dehydrogenase
VSTSFPQMQLTVIGAGYLGLTHAVCMADLGHSVLALDIDPDKITRAASGEVPFYEPELEALLRKNLAAGRLQFTSSYRDAAKFSDVHFLCVGTPATLDGTFDLSQINAAADALAPYLRGRTLVIGRSTVPMGTGRALGDRVRNRAPRTAEIEIAWNPEFLREGQAVQDCLLPDRFVFGVSSDWSAATLREIYAKPVARGVPVITTGLETAELVKVAANAFLATKLSFINAIAEVCEEAGADVIRVVDAFACDQRIGGRFLMPGIGYGGGCLPKDVRGFKAVAEQLGIKNLAAILGAVDAINLRCRSRVVDLTRNVVGGSLAGHTVAVLGVAFKPGSDDVRDSASLDVCRQLVLEGAAVAVHDPEAMENAARLWPDLRYAASPLDAARGTDAMLHLTDWEEYRLLDPERLGAVVARRNIIDGRSVLDARLWESAGWSFHGLGRR